MTGGGQTIEAQTRSEAGRLRMRIQRVEDNLNTKAYPPAEKIKQIAYLDKLKGQLAELQKYTDYPI